MVSGLRSRIKEIPDPQLRTKVLVKGIPNFNRKDGGVWRCFFGGAGVRIIRGVLGFRV